jgi:hypothetical protein
MRDERKPPHSQRPRAIEHQSARTMTPGAKYRLPSPKDSYYRSNIHPCQPGGRVSNDIALETLREW